MDQALLFWKRLFQVSLTRGLADPKINLWFTSEYGIALVAGFLAATPALGWLMNFNQNRKPGFKPELLQMVACLLVFLVTLAFVADRTHQAFIYFRF